MEPWSWTRSPPLDGGTGTSDRAGDVALGVEDLAVSFPTDDGLVRAVRGISYQVRLGEALGIVGESGSGKSVAALAVLGLLPRTAHITGSVRVLGSGTIGLDDEATSAERGDTIAMIFQDPLASLNPVLTVGMQLVEAVRAHHDVGKREARSRAVSLLAIVGIPDPRRRIHSYPHELSGGMRQRVMIAIAMANNPDVIIADEPTTALDVTVQAQVMEALESARRATGAALVLITHDLGVIAGHADRVGVMYAGRLVESGTVEEIFYSARMPYTLGLLGSQPRLDRARDVRLSPIAGSPPSLLDLPGLTRGCPFAPRCPMADDLCLEYEPDLVPVTDTGHLAACHFSDRLAGVEPAELFRRAAGSEERS